MSDQPLAYFITFRTYGTWLHGDDRGATDRRNRSWGEPHLTPDSERRNIAYSRLARPPVTFTPEHRRIVEAECHNQCVRLDWTLHAINVRTEHVHLVVSADVPPERVMTALKAGSTSALRARGLWADKQGPWSRHGSTRYLWKESDVEAACLYVTEMQDTPKEVQR